MSKEKPRLTEVSVASSAGGKVQIIKFDVSSDYFVSLSQKYEIPEGWSDEDALEFQVEKYNEIRAIVDAQAQNEFDERWEQSYLNNEV